MSATTLSSLKNRHRKSSGMSNSEINTDGEHKENIQARDLIFQFSPIQFLELEGKNVTKFCRILLPDYKKIRPSFEIHRKKKLQHFHFNY